MWRLTADAAGDLNTLALNGQFFAPFQAEVSGRMLDLTHHWHWQAEAGIRDFDLRAWHLSGALGAISGKLSGKCLNPVDAHKDYWFDWMNHHSSTAVFGK